MVGAAKPSALDGATIGIVFGVALLVALLGVRLAARRPRRLILNALSVAVTVCGIVAVQSAHTRLSAADQPAAGFSAAADL